MPDIRIIGVNSVNILTFDWLQTPVGLLDETQELATAIIIALNTDALADVTDKLPDPRSTDRRGWWGDTDASSIWQGWNIGCKLWLLKRAKIVDSSAEEGATVSRVQTYISQALQPFVDNKIITTFTSTVTVVNQQRIDASIIVYRGALQTIQLNFQPLWQEIFPANPMW